MTAAKPVIRIPLSRDVRFPLGSPRYRSAQEMRLLRICEELLCCLVLFVCHGHECELDEEFMCAIVLYTVQVRKRYVARRVHRNFAA